MKTLIMVVLVLLLPVPALATEVSIQPRVGMTVLGLDAPTGGLSAGVDGRVLWSFQENAGVYAGAGIDAIGLTGGWYHMGLIAGPRVGGWYQWKTLYLSGGVGLLYGQLSLCQKWDAGARQCMRWWDAWRETHLHAGYRTKDMHIGLDLSALYLRPTWGTDLGFSIAASGSWR